LVLDKHYKILYDILSYSIYILTLLIFQAKEVKKMKAKDWQELTRLTQGAPMVIERVSLPDSGIAIEGAFDLPPLARLPAEDQVFVMAFVRAEGTIKEMERTFGVSYPTIKSRLSRIAGQLQFVETIITPPKQDVIAALEKGEITAEEAIERLSK
jgi:hypothetical protein